MGQNGKRLGRRLCWMIATVGGIGCRKSPRTNRTVRVFRKFYATDKLIDLSRRCQTATHYGLRHEKEREIRFFGILSRSSNPAKLAPPPLKKAPDDFKRPEVLVEIDGREFMRTHRFN